MANFSIRQRALAEVDAIIAHRAKKLNKMAIQTLQPINSTRAFFFLDQTEPGLHLATLHSVNDLP